MEPKSAPSWNRTPNFFRTSYRRFSRRPTIWSPSTQISPRSGRSSPRMFLSNTDFPVPEGPRMAVIRPLGTSKVMSSRTVWEPKDLVTPRREMIGSPGATQGWAPCCRVSMRGELASCPGLARCQPRAPPCESAAEQPTQRAADVIQHVRLRRRCRGRRVARPPGAGGPTKESRHTLTDPVQRAVDRAGCAVDRPVDRAGCAVDRPVHALRRAVDGAADPVGQSVHGAADVVDRAGQSAGGLAHALADRTSELA